MNIDPDVYRDALKLPSVAAGGQELILGEVVGALAGCTPIWIPFAEQCGTLIETLTDLGAQVMADNIYEMSFAMPEAQAVYFGTPTIVNDRPLFPTSGEWDKAREREMVRRITERCAAYGYKRLVCGLGSGDIDVPERIEDIGGGELLAVKRFDKFIDWVIAKEWP